MTLRNYSSTAAETTLSVGVNSSATTLTVSATTGFPAVPFVLAIDAGAAAQELALVTNVAGTTLTVTRGFDSTVASAHSTGAVVAHSHAAVDFREANAHVNATSGVHGATGPVVGTTDVQTLTNKTLTSPTVNDATINESGLRLGYWQTYTPTLGGSAGTVTVNIARYTMIGKTCIVMHKVTSTTDNPSLTLSLPVPATANSVTAVPLASTTTVSAAFGFGGSGGSATRLFFYEAA